MSEFKQYRKKALVEARPYIPGEALDGVTVNPKDTDAGSPKAGDMIARQPHDHSDSWLIAATAFASTYVEA